MYQFLKALTDYKGIHHGGRRIQEMRCGMEMGGSSRNGEISTLFLHIASTLKQLESHPWMLK